MICRLTLALFAIAQVTNPALAVVTFDWAIVGNPGNAGEFSGGPPDSCCPGRIVGGVDYVFRISKHEVTAGQYTEFLNAVAASDPHGLYHSVMWTHPEGCKIERLGHDGSYTYQVAADWENRPVHWLSFFDAMRFTNWLHNGQGNADTESGAYTIGNGLNEVRTSDAAYWIPSEDEWYKAAYHKNDGVTGNYFDWPTGSDIAPNNDIINPDPGNNANYYQSGFAIGEPYWTTEVGEFENSASPYGTFDQGGNVWEWNEELKTINSTTYRVLRGGTYNNNYLHANNGGNADPISKIGRVGFRVASAIPIPEPATLTLAALACVGLMGRRR